MVDLGVILGYIWSDPPFLAQTHFNQQNIYRATLILQLKKMKKVILFDFWGTLVENGVWSPTKQVQHILRIDAPFSDYVVRMERAMMTKPFSSLTEAFQSVYEEFAIEPNQKELELLIGLWNKNWMLAKPYMETIAVLKTLSEKYTVVLISNSDCFGIKNVLEKFMKYVTKELKVKIEDCVIVGDSLQSDMVPAQKAGMKTILVDRKIAREFEPRIASLKELEGVLEQIWP